MTYYRNPNDPLSGEAMDIQYDDAWETEKDYKIMEPLEEERSRDRHAYRQRGDRMIELAAEASIIRHPGLSESETYDFFISYASEDKESFVHELAQQLRKTGAKVWYDVFILRPGHSLRRQIDEGLANSLLAVVVLSKPFFAKGWSKKELDNLISPETRDSDKRIFPLRHRVSKDEVIRHSPRIPDWAAFKTSEYLIEDIAAKMLQAKERRLAQRKGGAYS